MRQFGKTGLFLAVLAVIGMFGCGGSSGPKRTLSCIYFSAGQYDGDSVRD